MQYIIWGAGQRGKRALQILGTERVLFYVDSDIRKIGTTYMGKEIRSPETLEKMDGQNIVLISPVDGADEIGKRLEKSGIREYFYLSDCPYLIELNETERGIFDQYDITPSFDSCGIYGIGWFSLYLYDYLKEKGVQVSLIPQEKIDNRLLICIEGEYNINSLDYVYDHMQKILIADQTSFDCNLVPDKRKEKILFVTDFFDSGIKFCNSKISKFEGIHQGKRCFIVATGPSLTAEDLNVLYEHHELCISMNRIYNIFPKTEWRPDYYFIEDSKMIEDLSEEIANLELPYKFVSANPESYWEQPQAASSIKCNMIVQDYKDMNLGFSRNLDRCVYNGRTVTYACLQLAVYMGFKEIFLLGVDFSYAEDVYDPSNHFEGYQNYYKDIRLNKVHPDLMILAYKKARDICESIGVKVYNATRGGKLEVFERKSFDELFGGN